MERKSAWSLPMSEQEIVNEYKAAKKPQSQIAILADQNGCEKKTIVNILEAAGCELPGNFKKKKKEQSLEELGLHYTGSTAGAGGSGTHAEPPFTIPPAPKEVNIEKKTLLEDLDFSKVQPEPVKEEPLPIAVHVRLAALRSIERMIPEDGDIEDVDHTIFAQRVAGILQLVWEVEHGKI